MVCVMVGGCAVCASAEGLPVCVQIAARPFDDELCLRVMADVERGIAYDTRPSGVCVCVRVPVSLCATACM